jgi:serine/threonine protein phosphatase PrpC
MSEENHPMETSASEPASSLQPISSATGALSEGEVPQPPRPLVPGAFLGGEYEVKELLARGLVNFYLASGGDYAQPSPFLVAERELIAPSEIAVPEAPVKLPFVELVTENTPSTPAAEIEEAEAAIVATLGESEAAPIEEHPEAVAEVSPRETLQSPLFAAGRCFVQDGREYLICEWQETQSLQDWREPTNDARYLRAMSTLLEGACELEAKNLTADFSHDTLRFDEDGELKYFGFVDPQPENQPPIPSLQPLQEIHSFLLKHVFAESATMRLDDEWSGLALAEEVKAFATKLDNGTFASADEALRELPSSPPNGVLRVEAILLSDVGQEREINEDAGMIVRLARAGHLQNLEVELYAVADGMGGHEGGELASDLTLNALQSAFFARADLDWRDNVAVRAALWQVIEEVNAAVVELAAGPQYRNLRNKPGATLVFALRVGSTLFVGNVGDSRAYLWDEVLGLRPITKDHSYVQSLIDSGQLDPAEAWGHPDSSVITAHIGMQKLKQRDVFLRLATPGAKLLLVTDGVIDMLRDEEIAPFLQDENPSTICRNLVDAANAAGGFDNITVVCISFG